jgi:5'-nucleotidase/UDP-sugar diphosphatase
MRRVPRTTSRSLPFRLFVSSTPRLFGETMRRVPRTTSRSLPFRLFVSSTPRLFGETMRRVLIVVALLLAFALPACAADTFLLTLLHTNDLHGMMRPFDYDDRVGYFGGEQKDMGGLARRATLIRRLRREAGHPVLAVDCGDVFADGPWSTRLYGVAEIEAMNRMGYDLFAVGNNEFQATGGPDAQDKMLLLIRRSRFPWLAANLTVAGSEAPVEGVHPFVVRTFGDVRVAFLGLIPARVAEYDWIKGWTTEDPIAAARRWVPVARKEADLVIALVHLGPDTARELVAQVPGIDAVVGGDSHTFTPEVVMMKSAGGRDVPYTQAGEKGVVLGRFDLTFEHGSDWRLTAAKETLLPIDDRIPESPRVRELLQHLLDAPTPVGVLQLAPAG